MAALTVILPASLPASGEGVVVIVTSAVPRAVTTSSAPICAPVSVGLYGSDAVSMFAFPVPATISTLYGSMSQVPVLPLAAVVSTLPLMFIDL